MSIQVAISMQASTKEALKRDFRLRERAILAKLRLFIKTAV
jgi:hypothetical protein